MRTDTGPQRGKARSRLREAQRRESEALMAVEAAQARHARAEARLEDVMQQHRKVVEEADLRLAKARAELVETSGLQRAASLLDTPVATLRAAARRSNDSPEHRRVPSRHVTANSGARPTDDDRAASLSE